MWSFKRVFDDELVNFLFERLDSAGMEMLDGHEPLDFRVTDHHPKPNVYQWYKFVRGCGVCSRDPVSRDDGTFDFHESLVEPWPCPHVRSLATAFADDAWFRESWWLGEGGK